MWEAINLTQKNRWLRGIDGFRKISYPEISLEILLPSPHITFNFAAEEREFFCPDLEKIAHFAQKSSELSECRRILARIRGSKFLGLISISVDMAEIPHRHPHSAVSLFADGFFCEGRAAQEDRG